MSLNVLVVDDSAVMRRMVTRTLRMSGLPLGDVHEAGSGLQALEVLDGVSMDLALIDINMPGMNGIELLERLRAEEETKALPVVVVSTEGNKDRIAHIRELGAAFVRKPFSPEGLVDVVVEAIGGGEDE